MNSGTNVASVILNFLRVNPPQWDANALIAFKAMDLLQEVSSSVGSLVTTQQVANELISDPEKKFRSDGSAFIPFTQDDFREVTILNTNVPQNWAAGTIKLPPADKSLLYRAYTEGTPTISSNGTLARMVKANKGALLLEAHEMLGLLVYAGKIDLNDATKKWKKLQTLGSKMANRNFATWFQKNSQSLYQKKLKIIKSSGKRKGKIK